MNSNFAPLRYRQIHLDFHTSEAIPAVGSQFDAEQFVQTLEDAHVDSVTLFARCHHGWSYYPSKVGPSHPNLTNPDLLGEMVDACRKADIETPIYITVQWDEYLARTRPEWRVMSAQNSLTVPNADDRSSGGQLSATWHSLCLSHQGLFDYVRDTALEVADRYAPPGLFFDIVTSFDCVCSNCLSKMQEMNLDPENAADRALKDQVLAAAFRERMSAALWQRHPGTRAFYNAGHIPKRHTDQFSAYSHFEIESLPTGGWGYDHFPASARFTRALGIDTLGQTGKFHTLWGEFGGFKSVDALIYECSQMVALGTKCLIGDQLHPSGVMNSDTYASVAPAYARIKALEPYLDGAEQISDVAILALESARPDPGQRSTQADDGAVQMLLEMQIPFDIVTDESDLQAYRLLILPDDVPVSSELAHRISQYRESGGMVIASGRSGLALEGDSLEDARSEGGSSIGLGVEHDGVVPFDPCYLVPQDDALGERVPRNATVLYGRAQRVRITDGECLARLRTPYFQRTWQHFCSHQHAPDDPASDAGPAIVVTDSSGYIACPIFSMYKRIGQPVYKHLVEALIDRLLPERTLRVSLPSGGRASLVCQEKHNRQVLHLLYGGPQVRGIAVDDLQHGVRSIEVIEDVPHLGPLVARVATQQKPVRIYDALSGDDIDWQWQDSTAILNIDGLHIHRALVIENEPYSQENE